MDAAAARALFERRAQLSTAELIASPMGVWCEQWDDESTDKYLAIPALKSPEAVLAALAHASTRPVKESARFRRYLLRRLWRKPHRAATPVLRELWSKMRGKAEPGQELYAEELAFALLACGDRPEVELVAADLGGARESVATVSAVFLLDPASAFDELGARLIPRPKDSAFQARRRVILALIADGIHTKGEHFRRSTPALGWIGADPRWVPALLAIRKVEKGDLEAGFALRNADPQVVAGAARSPTAKREERGAMTALGHLEHAKVSTWPSPVWTAPGLIAVATSADGIAVHRVAAGLPAFARMRLPEPLRFATGRVQDGESPWERAGVLQVAIRRDGKALALVDRDAGVTLVDLKGMAKARWPGDGRLAHAAVWGAKDRTLWVAYVDEHGHGAAALDGKTLEEIGRCALGGSFPDPAWFGTHPHPTEDVGVFSIACGQDGWWCKVVEHRGKTIAPRKQKLGAKGNPAPLMGFTKDLAATGLAARLLLRSWPELAPLRGKVLGGRCLGGVVVAGHAWVSVAEGGDAPTALHAYRLPDGERSAVATWPAGEALLDTVSDALVTMRGRRVAVWSVGSAGTRG